MPHQTHAQPYAPLFPYLGLSAGAVMAEGQLVNDNFASFSCVGRSRWLL